MPISSRQIRAARGILSISQKELATKSNLSINSLNNIERDVGSPRAGSLAGIEKALAHEGIEFLENDGVRLRGEQLDIKRFEGTDILQRMYDDQLKAFPAGDGEVLTIGKDNRRFHHFELGRLLAYKRFERFAIRNNIKERALFLENDTNFLSSRNIYRWVPRELFGAVPMTIYGNNVAIILWGPPVRMIVIRNPGIAETFRQHFEVIWAMGKAVPEDLYKFHYQKTQKILEHVKEAKEEKKPDATHAHEKKPAPKPKKKSPRKR